MLGTSNSHRLCCLDINWSIIDCELSLHGTRTSFTLAVVGLLQWPRLVTIVSTTATTHIHNYYLLQCGGKKREKKGEREKDENSTPVRTSTRLNTGVATASNPARPSPHCWSSCILSHSSDRAGKVVASTPGSHYMAVHFVLSATTLISNSVF